MLNWLIKFNLTCHLELGLAVVFSGGVAILDLFSDGTAPNTWGPYKVPGGDATTIPYFIVSAKAEDGTTVTFTCTNNRDGKATMSIDTTGKKVITTYTFKCDYITPSA